MATLNRQYFENLIKNFSASGPPEEGQSISLQQIEWEGEQIAIARNLLALMDQYGVNDLTELPDSIRDQLPNRGVYNSGGPKTFLDQVVSFVTNPAFLLAAGGVAGVAAGGAGAAGAGAGEAAAGTEAALGSGITAGAAGQTGLTAGTATGGIGAGALGSGLITGGSTAGTGIAAAGAGALGAGYFGSETAYPVIGGQTAAITGAGAGAGTGSAQGTALSRILNGTATQDDYLQLAGQVAPSLLQMYGANQQQNQLQALAQQYIAMGAPYREQLASISQDPSQFYNSPGAQQALDATLRKLSVQGNPAGSPYSQSLAIGSLYDRYGQERQLLGNLGGLSGYNAAAPQTAQNAIGAGGQFYNAIGTGLGNVLNPQPSLADMFKKYGTAAGQYGYGY